MQYILILRELTQNEKERVNALVGNEGTRIVVVPELADAFGDAVVFRRLGEEEKKSINSRLFKSILEFGDLTIEGQTISSHLTFDGAGLWYYHKFRIYFNLMNQQHQVAEMNSNLEGASTATIYAPTHRIHQDKLDAADVEIIPPPKKRKEHISLWAVLQYGMTVALRFLKSLVTSSAGFKSKKYICIDSVAQYRNMLSLDGSSIIYENVFTGYLYQKKGAELGFIDQLLVPKFKGKDKYRFDIRHIKNHNNRDRMLGERVISRASWSPSILKKVLKARGELKRKYALIKQHAVRASVQQQILDEFVKLHSTTTFYLFKFYAYLRFFKDKSFDSVMTVDENSANYKIVLDAAKQHGIYTIGYQHGNISRFSPNYMYSKSDLAQKPMPDLTITWGSKWVALLQDAGNYTGDSLAIAGQIRTDVIEPLEQNGAMDREAIVPEINERDIVLFATQPQKDESLRCRAAEDVVLACKNIDSVHLIFKLHPRETDPEFYINIARKLEFNRFSLLRDKELYLLLKVADVVITCFSTVGTEALYFHKPLIVLDHLKEDILGYHRDGVAFQATNADELNNCIEGILKKELSLDPSVLAKYLQQSTYKVDGMVSERVWQALRSGRARV